MIHVISLGGSAVFGDRFDLFFLKELKALIKKSKDIFHIVVGGGKIARDYQWVGKKFNISDNPLDQIGIKATELNAELVSHIFDAGTVIKTPEKPGKERVNIYSGWKPGASTDYVSVVVAKKLNIDKIINITSVGYLYDKEPSKKDAKKIIKISKKEVMEKFKKKWSPGLKFPFDPKAIKESNGIDILIIGKSIKNIDNILKSKQFKGTTLFDSKV